MLFRQLFDRESCTYTYLLADPATGEALLIDPVLELVDRDLDVVEGLGLKLVATLETHVHADHVTGAATLRARTGSEVWVPATSGAEGADRYVADGEVLRVGAVELTALSTPGHTDGCTSYVWHDGQTVFTGDTLMVRGCGRTDFQQGSNESLWGSVHDKLFTLPHAYTVRPGHDYKGRTESSVDEEVRLNPRLGGTRTLAEFIEIMDGLGLAHPKKIDIAVPANLKVGAI